MTSSFSQPAQISGSYPLFLVPRRSPHLPMQLCLCPPFLDTSLGTGYGSWVRVIPWFWILHQESELQSILRLHSRYAMDYRCRRILLSTILRCRQEWLYGRSTKDYIMMNENIHTYTSSHCCVDKWNCRYTMENAHVIDSCSVRVICSSRKTRAESGLVALWRRMDILTSNSLGSSKTRVLRLQGVALPCSPWNEHCFLIWSDFLQSRAPTKV